MAKAFERIRSYERSLADRLLDGLATMPEIRVWGITNPADRERRFPTVSITRDGIDATSLAKQLADKGIYCWDGNYYALPLTERLGVEPEGMVRIGLAHYNTPEEVDRLLAELAAM